MNQQKIKAFTVLEVTVTMMISAILIGITYTAYTIISKSYLSFQSKNNDMAAIERLDELLKKDFDRAELIEKDPNDISFKIGEHIIKYEFNPDFIVRTSGIVDTFKLKPEEVIVSFEGQPIGELSSSAEDSRLDELSFSVLFQGEKIPYYYYKQYSSVNLIQRNPNAIH